MYHLTLSEAIKCVQELDHKVTAKINNKSFSDIMWRNQWSVHREILYDEKRQHASYCSIESK